MLIGLGNGRNKKKGFLETGFRARMVERWLDLERDV